MRIYIERRDIRGYACSGCGRRTWRVRDRAERTWDDLPWAEHRVTLIHGQRRVDCRTCGIRTEQVLKALRWQRHDPFDHPETLCGSFSRFEFRDAHKAAKIEESGYR
jgi:transposase